MSKHKVDVVDLIIGFSTTFKIFISYKLVGAHEMVFVVLLKCILCVVRDSTLSYTFCMEHYAYYVIQ